MGGRGGRGRAGSGDKPSTHLEEVRRNLLLHQVALDVLSGTFREGLRKTEVAVNFLQGPGIPCPHPRRLWDSTWGLGLGPGRGGTHVRAGQQLLHDVGVEDLPAASQALLLRL